jgi:hypothetical protein
MWNLASTLPAIGRQMRWAKNTQPLGIATVKQFASDQCSFYCFANANVVSYQSTVRQ